MTESLRRFALAELERAGSRDAALPRIGGFGHVARLRGLLTPALAELEEASAALLANVAEQEEHEARGDPSTELFEEGGRLSVIVHLRVETVVALARLLLDRVAQAIERYVAPADGIPLGSHDELEENLGAFARRQGLGDLPPRLLEQARRLGSALHPDRDVHVALTADGRIATASVWSLSGDASISPGPAAGSVRLDELAELLDAYVDDIVAYLVTSTRN